MLVPAASTSLPLLFSSYLTLVLPLPPCPLLHLSFYLKLSGRSGRNCLLSLPPVLSGYNGSPDTRFSREATRLMSWPVGERYLCSLQSLVVSLLLPLVSTLVFSRTGGVLSLEILRHTGSLDFHRGTVLPRHACCVFTRLLCNGHSILLSSYLSRIGRIENSFCSACGHSSQDTSHLILHCPATDSLRRSLFDDSLFLYDLWFRPWGVSWLHGLSPWPPIPRNRLGNKNSTNM